MPGSPKAPAPLPAPMSPQQWVQSAWPAPASWAVVHWSEGLFSVVLAFLLERSISQNFLEGHVPRRSVVSFQFSLTFLSFSVAEGADNLTDAVLRADTVWPNVPSPDNLCSGDVSVCCFCGKTSEKCCRLIKGVFGRNFASCLD